MADLLRAVLLSLPLALLLIWGWYGRCRSI